MVVAGLGENQIIWYENKMAKPSGCVLSFALGEKSSMLPKLTSVRDDYLKSMPGGESIIKSYYEYSPAMVRVLRGLKSVADLFINN